VLDALELGYRHIDTARWDLFILNIIIIVLIPPLCPSNHFGIECMKTKLTLAMLSVIPA
jgi:hypothetical protein